MRRGLGENPILLLHLIDLRLASGQPDDRRVEEAGILTDFPRSVVRRIDGYEENAQRLVVGRLAAQLDQPGERGRAYVPAPREAEVDGIGFAGQGLAGKGIPVSVDQGEGPAKVRRFTLRTCWP